MVAICPELCACAVPIVCKSRRSSFIWPSSSALFFCSWEVCNTSQRTSAATTITTPMSTPFILSPVHLRETVSLLYPELRAAESSRKNKRASPSRSPSGNQYIRQPDCSARAAIFLPAQLQRKLELPRIVRRRRLPRAASGSSSRVAQLVHRRHVEPVRQVEAIRNHIELEMFAQIKPPRKPQIKLEEPRRHECVAPKIAVASERRGDSRYAERLPAVCQADRRHHKRLARNERRRCSRGRRANRRPPVRRA